MTKAKKRGRPVARDWVGPKEAAEALNLSAYQLAQLRSYLKNGTHYRVLNPQATAKGRRYRYHPDRIQQWWEELEIPF